MSAHGDLREVTELTDPDLFWAMELETSSLVNIALTVAAAMAAAAAVSAMILHRHGASSDTAEAMLKASAILGAVALLLVLCTPRVE